MYFLRTDQNYLVESQNKIHKKLIRYLLIKTSTYYIFSKSLKLDTFTINIFLFISICINRFIALIILTAYCTFCHILLYIVTRKTFIIEYVNKYWVILLTLMIDLIVLEVFVKNIYLYWNKYKCRSKKVFSIVSMEFLSWLGKWIRNFL